MPDNEPQLAAYYDDEARLITVKHVATRTVERLTPDEALLLVESLQHAVIDERHDEQGA